MKEVLYQYRNRGMYVTGDDTAFGGERYMKLVAEPHDFALSVGGEVLRNSCFGGCAVVVSPEGEAVFYDPAGNVIGQAEKAEGSYREARFAWTQDAVSVIFGHMVYIDNYPNCDGEHDRWDERWEAQRTVTLMLKDHSIRIQ